MHVRACVCAPDTSSLGAMPGGAWSKHVTKQHGQSRKHFAFFMLCYMQLRPGLREGGGIIRGEVSAVHVVWHLDAQKHHHS